ncbi:MAG: hypothetical protein ACR2K2_11380 [Mycobacteriales bacterium]
MLDPIRALLTTVVMLLLAVVFTTFLLPAVVEAMFVASESQAAASPQPPATDDGDLWGWLIAGGAVAGIALAGCGAVVGGTVLRERRADRRAYRQQVAEQWRAVRVRHDAVLDKYARHLFDPSAHVVDRDVDDVTVPAAAAFFTALNRAELAAADRTCLTAVTTYQAAVARLEATWVATRRRPTPGSRGKDQLVGRAWASSWGTRRARMRGNTGR